MCNDRNNLLSSIVLLLYVPKRIKTIHFTRKWVTVHTALCSSAGKNQCAAVRKFVTVWQCAAVCGSVAVYSSAHDSIRVVHNCGKVCSSSLGGSVRDGIATSAVVCGSAAELIMYETAHVMMCGSAAVNSIVVVCDRQCAQRCAHCERQCATVR
jgi:hypothetical protein